MQTEPLSGAYNAEQPDVNGGEDLEVIAASIKPFRELSCSSNIRTNLEPEGDRGVLRGIVCVKLKDDIHNPVELNKQTNDGTKGARRGEVQAIGPDKRNDKMTSNLSKWIRTRVKEK